MMTTMLLKDGWSRPNCFDKSQCDFSMQSRVKLWTWNPLEFVTLLGELHTILSRGGETGSKTVNENEAIVPDSKNWGWIFIAYTGELNKNGEDTLTAP